MRLNRTLLASILMLIMSAANLFSQTTTVPAEAKSKTAPFLFTPETVKTGEQIFNTNCKSCHGDPGKGNYAKLTPIPKDPASTEYQKNTDGEIYYFISNGKGVLMPNFSNTLNEEQRWQVLSYVRSFNKNYKQPPIKTTIVEAVKTETAKIVLYCDTNKKTVVAIVTDSVAGQRVPLANISIKLFVKRTFGNLLISEALTGKEGIAYFNLPLDIPGDSLGNLTLIAKTQGNNKELSSLSKEKIGVITKPKNILDQRTWWNINSMAPIWLISLFTLGLLAILSTILYILFQLRKIKKINQTNTPDYEK